MQKLLTHKLLLFLLNYGCQKVSAAYKAEPKGSTFVHQYYIKEDILITTI